MRLSDVHRPAMEWSEAAMLPAIVRTLSQGAALGQLKRLKGYETAILADTPTPAPADNAQWRRALLLRRAAYAQIRRLR